MKLIFLSYFPAIIGLLLLGAVAYVNNPRRRVNVLFCVFATSVASWLFALYCADSAKSEQVALWSLRVAMLLGSVVGYAFLLLADSFPTAQHRYLGKKTNYAILTMTVVFMGLALTSLMSGGIERTEVGTTLSSLTVVYSLQTLSLFAQIIAGIIFVLRRRKTISTTQRAQIRLFVFGMCSAIIIGSLPGFIFIILDIQNRANAFLTGASFFVFGLCVLVAITKHRMFNIRSLVARTIAYFLSLLAVTTIYALLVGLVIERLTQTKVMETILTGASAFVAVILFKYVRSSFNRLTNKLFYREAYSSRQKLDALTNELVTHAELDMLGQKSLEILEETLSPQKIAFLLLSDNRNYVYGYDFKISSQDLRGVVSKRSAIHIVDDVDDGVHDINVQRLKKAGVDLVVAIRSAKRIEGYLLLGPRSSGEVYSHQDIAFLTIAARNIGLAVNNAKSYQEISEFNVTLKRKVTQATKQLREKNSELQRLHKTKDDFISMASHQLRPKLTATAGFLELLNKTGIPASSEQSELLGLAKQGVERMSDIVVDMLDINNMDSREMHLSIGDTKINLINVIKEEVNSINSTLERKRISLEPHQNLDPISGSFDEIKIREVITNLLHNALQYSSGPVVIKISHNTSKKQVEVRVVDHGIGMTKDEQKRLFEKFYRSEGAKRVRPMGSGIGLYASRLIVEAHGGSMIVRSTKNKGSEIGFVLPLSATRQKP